jgi:hypothetical protein
MHAADQAQQRGLAATGATQHRRDLAARKFSEMSLRIVRRLS